MQGMPYLQFHVLPNFYFHIVTTYNILRHNGVELGKMDFLRQVLTSARGGYNPARSMGRLHPRQ